MKVGDLVQLSAYGRERDYNKDLDASSTGWVLRITRTAYPYVILWDNQIRRSSIRRELKHARKTNEAR